MSDNIDTIKSQLWEKMSKKKYRDTFVAAHVATNIAAQINTLREDRKWTQSELGDKSGMSKARISLMENPSYDKFTLSTLKRLASAFDVALIVRFAPFSELVGWVATLSPDKLSVPEFPQDSIHESACQPNLVPTKQITHEAQQLPMVSYSKQAVDYDHPLGGPIGAIAAWSNMDAQRASAGILGGVH